MRFWKDGEVTATVSGISWEKDMYYLHIGYFSGSSDGSIKPTTYDWVRVRKYVEPEPIAYVGEEIAGTVTDSAGMYSWTFPAPASPGEHEVRVDVNDGRDFASVTTTLYVVDGLKIRWADVLPRVKDGYAIAVEPLDPNIDEVNLVLEGDSFSRAYPCTASGGYWYCDVNMYDINAGQYLLKAYGYSSGSLMAFDAKHTEAGPKKVFEFSTERDIASEANVDVTEDSIKLKRVCQDYTLEPGCWQYRRDVNVWFEGASVEYNVQIPLKFFGNDPIFEHARETGTDIRVVWDNNGTPVRLDYWIEEWTPTAGVGVIWVKVPELHPGENVLRIYYGEPTAPEGNVGPESIFEEGFWHLTAGCTDSALCNYTDNHEEFEEIVRRVIDGMFVTHGEGSVDRVYEDENPYGPDDQYFSWFRFLFIPDVSGDWYVATDSDDASEIVYVPNDDLSRSTVVTAWYGGHGVANNWSHNDVFQMAAGKGYWFDYRYTEWFGGEAGRMAVMRP
ncbi:TPA: DUF2341 domain-containing protein, partial [Candidatus Micrarchaeota archaeon]|nr:DUF2341 domain-containing protein [Candidatus Micrarchaeota archaeon]